MELSETKEFEIGGHYWTADGEKVALESETNDGKYVVCAIIRYEDHYDDFIEEFGPLKIVDRLYFEAPVAVLDEAIAKAQKKLDAINAEYQKRYNEVMTAERDIKNRMAKFAKHKALELVEDLIDGKITHYVVSTSDHNIGLSIKTADETIKGGGSGSYDRDLKLVTLFGRSNGDLQWKVNRYYDGSGDWKQIWPCRGAEHAQETLVRLVTDALEDQFKAISSNNTYWFQEAYKAAIAAGVVPREEIKTAYSKAMKASLEGQLAGAIKNFSQAQKALDDIRARHAQLEAVATLDDAI